VTQKLAVKHAEDQNLIEGTPPRLRRPRSQRPPSEWLLQPRPQIPNNRIIWLPGLSFSIPSIRVRKETRVPLGGFRFLRSSRIKALLAGVIVINSPACAMAAASGAR